MARRLGRWGLLLLTTLLVGCDHATKLAAKAALVSGRAIALVPGVLELRYTENRETAFSLTRGLAMPGKAQWLALVSALALASIVVVAWKTRGRATRLHEIAFTLVVAGAVGNVVDRIDLGFVVDFIHLQHWPVFNVADALIVVGGMVLLFGSRRAEGRAVR